MIHEKRFIWLNDASIAAFFTLRHAISIGNLRKVDIEFIMDVSFLNIFSITIEQQQFVFVG